MTAVKEGFVWFRGMRTWYRIVGDLDGRPTGRLPLLLLHGGPGQPSDYFEALEVLAGTGRPVVTYDQIGCGRSDRPADPALWAMGTFVDEVGTVRRSLALDHVHLLGHSWGGMLALEYALAEPAGIASLVLASSLFSTRLFNDEARRLQAELPGYARRAIGRIKPPARPGTRQPAPPLQPGMTAMTADRQAVALRAAYCAMANPVVTQLACRAAAVPLLRRVAYPAAGMEFMRRHTIRIPPRRWPRSLFRSLAGMNSQVHEVMAGPTGFYDSGTLKGWDVTSRLVEITVPTLITSGRYDIATPRQMQVLHEKIAGSRWVLFGNSAHLAFVEEPGRYRAVLDDFLAAVEPGPSGRLAAACSAGSSALVGARRQTIVGYGTGPGRGWGRLSRPTPALGL